MQCLWPTHLGVLFIGRTRMDRLSAFQSESMNLWVFPLTLFVLQGAANYRNDHIALLTLKHQFTFNVINIIA